MSKLARGFPAVAGTEPPTEPLDMVTLGRRLRHVRNARGLTLEQLGARVGRAASQLSLIENGRREPRVSLLRALAGALEVPLTELLESTPPSRRAGLEIELERYQRDPLFARLDVPAVRSGAKLPLSVLESLVALHREVRRQSAGGAATPEQARRANAALRQEMRERDNYYPVIEEAAAELLASAGHSAGPLSQRVILDITSHLGFTVHQAGDLPRSTRSITDLRNRRIYLPQADPGGDHDPRTVLLQTLGHFVLGHEDPRDHGDFLRQRVEANYFAAALMVPQGSAVAFLQRAKTEHALSVEDLRDVHSVSYETAAHRFTNLATTHLGLRVHFMRVHESGTIYKAYENDGVDFPTDAVGAIEGQLSCRHWASRTVFTAMEKFSTFGQFTDTPSGTYWCSAHVQTTRSGEFSVSVGVRYVDAKWFRLTDHTARRTSACPDERCCRRPPAAQARRWDGYAWPAARAHSHLLSALPPGTFPGVDETEVYSFLDGKAGTDVVV